MLAALTGSRPSRRLLFDGAWFSATPVPFAVFYALMRPAAVADAHLTPALPEIQ